LLQEPKIFREANSSEEVEADKDKKSQTRAEREVQKKGGPLQGSSSGNFEYDGKSSSGLTDNFKRERKKGNGRGFTDRGPRSGALAEFCLKCVSMWGGYEKSFH